MSFAMQINLILVLQLTKIKERKRVGVSKNSWKFFNTSGCIAVTPKYLLISNDEAKYNGNDKSF